MIQWAKFATKAKKIGSKAKGAVRKLKKDPRTKGFGKGAKIGTFAVGALAVGSGAYNLATNQRLVRLKKSDPNYKALKKAGYI